MRRRVFLRTAGYAAAGIAAGAAAWKGLRRDPRDLRAVRARIPCPGLPSGEVRLFVFSDVDWPRSRFNWETIPSIAAAFDPDLVCVAGDLLDRGATARDPATARAAGEWLASVAPGTPVLVAPGEAESPARERLAAAWEGRAEILANAPRRYEVRGNTLEVFVVDPKVDPAPWGLAPDGARRCAAVRGRTVTSTLAWRGNAALAEGFETTFAFRLDEAATSFEARVFEGWRLRSRQGSRAMRLRQGPGGSSAFVPSLGRWCRARVRAAATRDGLGVKARFWEEGRDEPPRWAIDVADAGAARSEGAALTFGVRHGLAALADLRVATLDGAVVLEERFEDPAAFRARWREDSRLVAWSRAVPAVPLRLILAHHPDVALTIAEAGLPRPGLVVAGHTHGGQLRLPGIGPVLTDTRLGRAYDRGLFEVSGTRLFVTAGVGTSILPIRWNVPPDVACLTLVPLVDSAAPEATP